MGLCRFAVIQFSAEELARAVALQGVVVTAVAKLLGCARPAGMHKRVTDAYAVMAGLDGIAFPADGAVALCDAIGRPFEQQHACCSIKVGGNLEAKTMATACAS